jgi:hypothetical protein
MKGSIDMQETPYYDCPLCKNKHGCKIKEKAERKNETYFGPCEQFVYIFINGVLDYNGA